MKPHKTRRVYVCTLCDYESQPLGTSNRVDQNVGTLAHEEMNRHIAEKHGDNERVKELSSFPISVLSEYPYLTLYHLEIRRNPT